jgi:hypothetical protein
MEHETESVVLHERKESKRAVASPLHDEHVAATRDAGLDEAWTLTECPDRVARALERGSIAVPGSRDRLLAVVKHVHVA